MHLHAEILAGHVPSAEIALVVSNNSGSGVLAAARERGLPAEHLSLASVLGDAAALETTMLQLFEQHRIDMIVLAGYMKKVPDAVVTAYAGRILNIHPALLPAFGGAAMYGRRVHEAVLERGCKVTGATAHLVTAEYDAGTILLQRCCPVLPDDTPETLEERVRAVEREIYPKALELLANARAI